MTQIKSEEWKEIIENLESQTINLFDKRFLQVIDYEFYPKLELLATDQGVSTSFEIDEYFPCVDYNIIIIMKINLVKDSGGVATNFYQNKLDLFETTNDIEERVATNSKTQEEIMYLFSEKKFSSIIRRKFKLKWVCKGSMSPFYYRTADATFYYMVVK